MKMYFLICGMMLLVFLLRVWVELNEYCRTHSKIVFGKRQTFAKRVFTIFQVYFYFCIPVVNVILFVYFIFFANDKIYTNGIEKRIVK